MLTEQQTTFFVWLLKAGCVCACVLRATHHIKVGHDVSTHHCTVIVPLYHKLWIIIYDNILLFANVVFSHLLFNCLDLWRLHPRTIGHCFVGTVYSSATARCWGHYVFELFVCPKICEHCILQIAWANFTVWLHLETNMNQLDVEVKR